MTSDPLLWQLALFLIGSYLLGAIPSAYLMGRWLRGIDIREYGSGNVGGSNVWHSVSRWAIVPVALFDIGKAVFVAWLALYFLEWGPGVAMGGGIMTLIGHAWSLFLDFNGGRGLSCIVGMLVVIFPLGGIFLIIAVITGYLLKNTGGTTLGLLALPFISLVSGEPLAVTLGTVGLILVTAIKRLEGNRVPLPEGDERWSVAWRRIWLDRDIADHQEWLKRRPGA